MASSQETQGQGSSSTPAASTDEPPLWDFVKKTEKVGTGGTWKFTCNFCKENRQGSYSRVKAHLLGIKDSGENRELLSWNLRVQIALDVARGLEYLHDGAVPPVIHRDIKSSNILLDESMGARVADFGLSREDMINRHASNIQGTFGYLDPEYISTRAFTKKSDVYSFGVLLFELIAGRNPQQGLLEYVELAALNTEGQVGWEEIADSRLDGNFEEKDLNDMAALAYKCVNRAPRKRPSMRDIVQVLSHILKTRQNKKHHKRSPSDVAISICQSDRQSSMNSEHHRLDSMDSAADSIEV